MSIPPLIDTHCHLNFDSYDADRDEIIARATTAGVTRLIIPAVDIKTSDEALALAHAHVGIFAAVGVHPTSTAEFDDATLAEIRTRSFQSKVIAIGEIGLDYYWDDSPKHKQFEAFEAQLKLATERNLPVIIHNRDAHEDTLAILARWHATLPPELKAHPGVLHSVSAPMHIAEQAIALGFYLGFTGPLTFAKAEETRRVAYMTPLDRILVETDAPFLTPHPYRGKRNEPSYVPLIVERLASVKGISIEEVAAATTANAERLFKLS